MLRQLVSRTILGRASASASSCVAPSSSPSCSTHDHALHCHNYSYTALRSFSSSSSSQPPAAPSQSPASSAAASSPSSSSSSSTDIPPNFYQNPYGENLSLYSEELTFTGHSKYLIPGPFGTIEKPAIIYSEHDSRIVGCVGGDGLPHDLEWFILKKGKKHVCAECAQVFLLQKPPAGNEAFARTWLNLPDDHHDDHHDEHGDGDHGKKHGSY